MAAPCDFVSAGNMPTSKGTTTNIHDLALVCQLLHRLPDLLPRSLTINMVHLVEIDMIGLQTAQTLLTSTPNVQSREARLIWPFTHLPVNLGRQHNFLPASTALSKPAPDDLFGNALTKFLPIDIGRIEKIDA